MDNYPASELPPNERPAEHTAGDEVKEAVTGTVVSAPYSHRYPEKPASKGISFGALFWSAMLIMAGGVFLAENLDFLPPVANVWDWLAMGAGVLMLVDAVLRTIVPDFHRPSVFTVIIGFVLLAYGIGHIFGVDLLQIKWFWPVLLIGVGLSMLGGALRRR